MPQLNLVTLTDDLIMEMDECPDAAPPVQTEAVEPRNVEEVMEEEESEGGPGSGVVLTAARVVPSPIIGLFHTDPDGPF